MNLARADRGSVRRELYAPCKSKAAVGRDGGFAAFNAYIEKRAVILSEASFSGAESLP